MIEMKQVPHFDVVVDRATGTVSLAFERGAPDNLKKAAFEQVRWLVGRKVTDGLLVQIEGEVTFWMRELVEHRRLHRDGDSWVFTATGSVRA